MYDSILPAGTKISLKFFNWSRNLKIRMQTFDIKSITEICFFYLKPSTLNNFPPFTNVTYCFHFIWKRVWTNKAPSSKIAYQNDTRECFKAENNAQMPRFSWHILETYKKVQAFCKTTMWHQQVRPKNCEVQMEKKEGPKSKNDSHLNLFFFIFAFPFIWLNSEIDFCRKTVRIWKHRRESNCPSNTSSTFIHFCDCKRRTLQIFPSLLTPSFLHDYALDSQGYKISRKPYVEQTTEKTDFLKNLRAGTTILLTSWTTRGGARWWGGVLFQGWEFTSNLRLYT